jgi:predicted ribonuclease YlaK
MYFYDTCTLLKKYNEIFKRIHDESFVISNLTLMELENIKTSKNKDNEVKYKAKKVSQLLNYYYGQYECINYEKEWDRIYIDSNPVLLDNNDTRIVISAFVYSDAHPDVIFVTDDVNCNNIARSLGLTTNVLTQFHNININTGYLVRTCFSENEMNDIYDRIENNDNFGLLENQYLMVQQDNNIIDSFVYTKGKMRRVPFQSCNSKEFGEVKPLDAFQKIAIHSLKNNKLTMLRGTAGTGKSLLGLGYLFECLESNKIDKIIIFCNTVATKSSAKLGYYPGSRTEKLLDSQIGNFLASKLGSRIEVERMIHDETLILLPMSDIRGFDTTGMNAGIYITEAQNLDIELMKLALQRIGEDAICILDGDSETQVDLDIYSGENNGMRRVSEVFSGQPFYGEVTLPICHRSTIAAIADKM